MSGEDETNIGDVIAVDDEKETLTLNSKAATSATQHAVAEVPRWRFVNTAKKSLGYSSKAAGSYIEGKSAAELVAQYNAPSDVEETNDGRKSKKNGSDNGVGKLNAINDGNDVVSEEYEANVKIGKVVVPSFMKTSSTQSTKPTETAGEDSTQKQDQQVEYLHELQLETDKMQQEKEHLEHDIDEAKKEKERIQKEKERIEKEAELAENKKERMEREAQFIKAEKERLEQERLAGESAELALLENEVAAAQNDETNAQDGRRRKYRTYGMYSFIILLLCGIAALLGVLLGGKESQEEADLRGSEAEIESSEPITATNGEQQEAKCVKFHLAIDTMNMKSNDVSIFEEEMNDAIENGLLYSAIMNTYPETNIAGLGHPSSTSSEFAGVGPSSILLDIVGSAIKDLSNQDMSQVEFYSAQDIRENTDQNDVMSQLITGFGEVSDQVLDEMTNSGTNDEAYKETRRRGLRISSKLLTFTGKKNRRLQTLQPVNATDVREYLISFDDTPCPDDLAYDPFAPRPPLSSYEILAEDDQPTTTAPPKLDGSSTEVLFPPSEEEEEEEAAAAEDIKCGEDTKPFELTVLVGDNPSEITWVIVDRCTNESFHKCNKCYNNSPPNFPISYSGCLPIYYEGDALRVREYALQMIDTEDEPSFGYSLVYDDETIFDVAANEQFTNLEFNYFGEDGGGCSQAPSEATTMDPTPSPTSSPTLKPTQPISTVIGPTIRGCTDYTGKTETCGRNAEMEFKIVMPGGLDDYENKFFGSSSTFVGDSQNVIAVGSGVDDSPIHIYRKSVASICVLMTTDTDAPSLNNIGSDGYILVEIDDINIHLFQFFGAGEVVLDRCFDRIDTIQITGPDDNGWKGSILFSTDGKETYSPFVCFGCTGDSDLTNNIAVDGNDNGGVDGIANCLNGDVCTLRISDEDVAINTSPVWEYLTSISLPDTETSSVLFGANLDSNDDGYIAVGAPLIGAGTSGIVFLYKPNADLSSWELVSRLTARTSQNSVAPSFGSSLSMDGDLLAIGSPDERDGAGSVYIFQDRNTADESWGLSFKLSPKDVAAGALFGSSVSVSSGSLAVGAPRDIGGGSVFAFKRNENDSWLRSQKLVPRDIEEGDEFGTTVVISGCTIAVASPQDRTSSTSGTGTVRTFNWDDNGSSWVHSQIVEHLFDAAGGEFGECIAFSGDTLLVAQSDVIYNFGRLGGVWSQISVITQVNFVSEEFGCPLSLSGRNFIVGSRGDNSLGTNSGASFVYDLCPEVEPV